jgi:hypothetical protein
VKKEKLISCIIIFLLLGMLQTGVQAEKNLFIDPADMTIDAIAGDTITVNVTIENSGNEVVDCTIYTTIFPDGIGLNVTFDKNTFTIPAGEKRETNMTIVTAANLVPGKYTIRTEWIDEIQEPTTPKKDTPTYASGTSRPPQDGGTDDSNDNENDQTNTEPNNNEDDSQDGDIIIPPYIPPDTKKDDDFLTVLTNNILVLLITMAVVFGTLFLVILILFKRKKDE